MSRATNRKGREGEDAAVRFLESLGFRIVDRNVRVPGGEIDVVAIDRETLVFVEVKRRDGRSCGTALAAVDRQKRRRLALLCADYAQIAAPRARFRFDVVAIDGNRLTLHRNAFT